MYSDLLAYHFHGYSFLELLTLDDKTNHSWERKLFHTFGLAEHFGSFQLQACQYMETKAQTCIPAASECPVQTC